MNCGGCGKLETNEASNRARVVRLRMIEVSDRQRDHRLAAKLRHWIGASLAALLALATLAGCDIERRKSDAELGLNSQQAAGRKIYDNHCDRCHRPDSTKGKKGPGLKGVFQRPYLAQTGLPANDERVGDIIRNGRPDMPGYGQVLSAQDIRNLLSYLHTL
jgi:mono/diheme cytochrome c family protein